MLLTPLPRVAQLSPAAQKYFAPVADKHGSELAAGLQKIWNSTDRPLDYRGVRDEMFATMGRAEGAKWATDLYTGLPLEGVTSRPTANENQVNTEHLWPQSRGARERIRADMHHLQATSLPVNEYRWHLPFGAVVDAQDGATTRKLPPNSGSVGFDAAGELVYEPRDAVKGVIARSLMYVYQRYGTTETKPFDWNPREFTDSLPTLLAWNAAYLPGPDELRRNDQIQQIQGTRNIFVDRPELADELMAGVATKRDPSRSRDEQVREWVDFLKDPSASWKNPSPEKEAHSKEVDDRNWAWDKRHQRGGRKHREAA